MINNEIQQHIDLGVVRAWARAKGYLRTSDKQLCTGPTPFNTAWVVEVTAKHVQYSGKVSEGVVAEVQLSPQNAVLWMLAVDSGLQQRTKLTTAKQAEIFEKVGLSPHERELAETIISGGVEADMKLLCALAALAPGSVVSLLKEKT